MPMIRDPQTGLVSMAGVDQDRSKNSYYTNEKFGPVRTKQIKYLEKERKGKINASGPGLNTPMVEPPALLISPNDPILLPSDDTTGSQRGQTCPNAEDRKDLRMEGIILGDVDQLVHQNSPFLNRLAQLCARAKIRWCESAGCVANRDRIEKLAPNCAWRGFSDWSLQLLACQATQTADREFKRPFFHMSAAVAACHWLVMDAKFKGRKIAGALQGKDKTKVPVEAFGVFEMIYWMLTIQSSLGINIVIEGKWSVDLLPVAITEPAVARAAQEAQDTGICPNRFWNLVFATERQHIDLPGIMHSAVHHPQLRHNGHEACTPAFCKSTTMDSTRMQQLHKCTEEIRKTCEEQLQFDPKLLNESIQDNGRTVWTCSQPFQVSQSGPYMAISHVWSDGTGIGLKLPGQVNKCLFDYFASIAEEFACTGIWWDTISIPTEPKLRRVAINQMHQNYSNAQCTVVHDQYLVDFDWKDDGSPCLALVFSVWLTRGWTALELIMSKVVKVIYKDPENGGPLVKDLDSDILAKDPGSCTRGHWIASTIIRRLRRPIHNVSDMLAVLRPRSTSWPRDRMVIAGLLSGIGDLDYSRLPHEITKEIVNSVVKLNPGALHHRQPTITESGGWSWCPPSLYDMPSETVGDVFEEGTVGDSTCFVDQNGVLAGYWHWRPLEKEDSTSSNLVPNAEHLSTILKIRGAIRRWEYCMLLRDNNMGDGLALLMIPVRRDKDFIHVKFVGSVRESSAKAGVFDSRFAFDSFKVGAEGPEAKVAPFYNKDRRGGRQSKTKTSGGDYGWICGKLWMGDHENSGQLLVARCCEQDDSVIEGFRVEIRTAEGEVSALGGGKVLSASTALSLSDTPVFRANVKSGVGVDLDGAEDSDIAIRHIKPNLPWPPATVPADDRTYVAASERHFSRKIFQLKYGSQDHLYAALSPKLFTPDEACPYKGIWTGVSASHGPIFLLFHQPHAARLEVVALTGNRSRPRGSLQFVVEDLNDIKKVSTEENWHGLPIVTTSFPAPEDWPLPDVVIDLLLVSKDEVIFMLPKNWVQLKRVAVAEYL